MKTNQINNRRQVTSGVHRVTSALSLSLAGAFLFASVNSLTAEETKAQKASAEEKTEMKAEKADMKVSQDGYNAMRAIHDARMAIFNGEPKVCGEMLTKAGEALAKATKDEAVAKVKGDMISIDGSIALADTFVPTEEKGKHVAKANEHFQKGDSKKGIEELKLGEIEVNFSRVLISLGTTKKRLSDAEDLAKGQKYYECNLALKAAEDAVVLDSVSLLEFPKADGKATDSTKKAGPETKAKK